MRVTLFFCVFMTLLCHVCFSVTVNSFAEVEDLYYSRKLKSTIRRDPYSGWNDQRKAAQCEKVLNARFFTSPLRNEIYADKSKLTVYKKASQYPKFCNFHYEIRRNESNKFSPKYPYNMEFKVWVKKYSKTTSQVMFPCLAINRITGNLVPYYISYGFVEGEGFLFEHWQDKLVVLALIEESPFRVQFASEALLEAFYVSQRKNAGAYPLLRNTPDPVCDLRDYEKDRLCAIIFDSPLYVNRVQFNSGPPNVEYNCQSSSVILPNFGSQQKLTVNSFSCKGILKNAGPIIYDVSQGFNQANSVFVFRTTFVEISSFYILLLRKKKVKHLQLDAYIKNITVLRENR